MPSLLTTAFNPLSSFRKKTRSFRLKSRQVFSESCQSTPVKYSKKKLESIGENDGPPTKQFFVDPELKSDRFFLKFRKHEKIPSSEVPLTSLKHVHSSPCIQKSIGFSNFSYFSSTKCLLEILKRLPAEDLRSARLVNKTFNKVVQDHAPELEKKKFYRLKLIEDESGCLALRKFGNSTTTPLMKLEKMDKALRHIEAKNFDFFNLTITGKTVKYLHRSIKYKVKEVKFFNCVFHITPTELSIFVRPWHLRGVEFHQCRWEPSEDLIDPDEDFFLTDRFFSLNRDIKSFVVDFTFQEDEQKLGFSHKLTSRIFHPSECPPRTFILNNCVTFMTSKTLYAAISSYCDYSESDVNESSLPYFYSWTFGRITESREQIMQSISPILENLHVEDYSNDNRIRLILKARPDFPPLMLDIHLRPFVASLWNFGDQNLNPEEEPECVFSDDDEIDYDDSSSEED